MLPVNSMRSRALPRAAAAGTFSFVLTAVFGKSLFALVPANTTTPLALTTSDEAFADGTDPRAPARSAVGDTSTPTKVRPSLSSSLALTPTFSTPFSPPSSSGYGSVQNGPSALVLGAAGSTHTLGEREVIPPSAF